MKKRTILIVAVVVMVMLTASVVYAAGEYPTSTTAKDQVITLSKSASWNGGDAGKANYQATVKLEATGIQTIVGQLPKTKPLDISFVMDYSGSMATCTAQNHVSHTVFGATTLAATQKTIFTNAVTGKTVSPTAVYPVNMGDSNYKAYAVPLMPGANSSSGTPDLSKWGVVVTAANGDTLADWPSWIASFYPRANRSAPYFNSHFVKNSAGELTTHIVYPDGTDYYHLADSSDVLGGWLTGSSSMPSNNLVSWRSISNGNLQKAMNDFGCRYNVFIVAEAAKKFGQNIVNAQTSGKLAPGSSFSLVPFAGAVSPPEVISQTKITSALATNIANKIDERYKVLGYYTSWGNAMTYAKNELTSANASTNGQKIIIIFTDGWPDVGDATETEADFQKSLSVAKSLYNAETRNRMYGVFLDIDQYGTYGNLARLVNAMNTNNSNDTSATGYIKPVLVGSNPTSVQKDLEQVYDEIVTYLEKWSKSTQIVSVEDTIDNHWTIDRSKLTGTEGKDWKIETVNGKEKITFYTSINGFTSDDKLVNQVPVVLKEAYRKTTKYYPTNDGNATCHYTDVNGKDATVATATPYLPVRNDDPENKKELTKINDEAAKAGAAVTVGDVVEYTITYENNELDAVDIVITDKIPEGTEFVEADNGGKLENGVVTWTLEGVASGVKGTVILKVKVTDAAKATLENEATIKIGDNDPVVTPKVTIPVPKKTLIAITPTEGDTIDDAEAVKDRVIHVGDVLEYEITYANTEKQAATVTITDKIPEGTEFVEADNGGKLENGVVTWTLEDVGVDESGSVKVKFKVTEKAKATVENTATVQVGDNDPVVTNVISNPLPSAVKEILSVNEKAAANYAPVTIGDVVEYKIAYTNPKKQDQDVVITDKIPEGTEFYAADNDGKAEGGTVTWTLTGVEAGASDFVTLKVKVTDKAAIKIINKATVKVGDDDPQETNEVVNPLVKKAVVKIGDKEGKSGDSVAIGQTITYEIAYANVTEEAQTIVITDKVPEGTEFVSADNDGKAESGTVTWTLKDVAAGKDGKVTMTLKATKAGTIKNIAAVKIGDGDPKDTNEVSNPGMEKKEEKAATTATKSDDGKKEDTVKTGDDSTLWRWLGLALAAMVAGGIAIYHDRKHRKICFKVISKKES